MSYTLDIQLCSKNGWFTPDEARNYYGKYSRDGITVHWWGDGTGADNHDNIVRYLNGRGAAGEAPTANYVLSDAKITKCVEPENVAWTSSNGNPTTIGVETQPTLGAEGYKKWGWLVDSLEKRFGKALRLYPHNYWIGTQCPGTLSLDRIRQEADKWKRGEYSPVPAPVPTPPAVPPTDNIAWTKLDKPQEYVCNKQPTNLWSFNQTSWGAFGNPVKMFNQGDKITIYGRGYNKTLRTTYLVTEYSYTAQIPNGFNEVDLSLVVQPVPVEPPIPAPEPAKPEWIARLRDIDNTTLWVKKDTKLIDITTGKPFIDKNGQEVVLKKDSEFGVSALTMVGANEYRITEYSFKAGVFNGVNINDLTLTAPGVPNIPPVPSQPPVPTVPVNVVVAFLLGIVKAITDFIASLTKKK